MNREKLLFMVFFIWMARGIAQNVVNADAPGIFDYVPIDVQPTALNFGEVRKVVGYPPSAMSAGVEGKVLCRVLIDSDGNYIQHKITRTDHPDLGKAVDPHVHLLKFSPAIRNSKKIVYWANVKFDFEAETQHYEFARIQGSNLMIKDLKKAEDRARFFLREGKVALEQRNYQSASRMLTQTIAISNDKRPKEKYLLMLFDGYNQRSKATYHLGYVDEAIEDLTLAIGMARSELDHKYEVRSLLPELYHRRASYYLDLNQSMQALQDLQWIDKFYPCRIPFAKAQLAELMLELGKENAALEHINEIEQCEQHSFDNQSQNILGYMSLLKGIAYVQQKSYQKAFTFLTFAQEHNPDNPVPFFYKGLAIWELGGDEHAGNNFKTALQLGLSGKLRMQAEEILASMH